MTGIFSDIWLMHQAQSHPGSLRATVYIGILAGLLPCAWGAARTPAPKPKELTSSIKIWRFNGFANNVAVQPNGQILVDGEYLLNSGDSSEFLTRLNPDGTVDSPFTQQVSALTEDLSGTLGVYDLAVTTDSRILVAWNLQDDTAFVTGSNLWRMMPDGSLDPTFSTQGSYGVNNYLLRVKITPDNRILVGGKISNHNGKEAGWLFRLMPNGAPDLGFEPRLNFDFDGAVQAIALARDGWIVAGLDYWLPPSHTNPNNAQKLLRLGSDGSVDAKFTALVPGSYTRGIFALAVQPDNKIIIGGADVLARLNADGTLDTTFGDLSPRLAPAGESFFTVRSLALQPDGRIVVAGDFSAYDGMPTSGILRLEQNGTLDEQFSKNTGSGFLSQGHAQRGVSAVALQSDGKILAVGPFDSFNGEARPYVARLNANGTLDSHFPQVAGTGLPE